MTQLSSLFVGNKTLAQVGEIVIEVTPSIVIDTTKRVKVTVKFKGIM